MKTIRAAGVSPKSVDVLDSMIGELPEPSLQDAIREVAAGIRAGQDVIVAAETDQCSPAAAAKLLGVSRTHLYKVMDSGELAWVLVGRDRRIAIADLKAYMRNQDEVRRTIAENFAHPSDVRKRALEAYKVSRRTRADG